MTSLHSKRMRNLVLVAACVVAAVAFGAVHASAAGGSYISGKVFAANGTTPLPGMEVRLWMKTGSWSVVQTKTSSSTGVYAFTGLNVGTYTVEFRDPTYAHAAEFYNDLSGATAAEATSMTLDGIGGVLGDGYRTNVNASLADAGSITGTVRDGVGAPVSGVTVNAYRRLGDGSFATTVAMSVNSSVEGTYALRGLAAGAYAVQFFSGIHARDNYYSTAETLGVTSRAFATPLTAVGGVTLSGVDAVMTGWGGIDGTVRSAGGPLGSVTIEMYRGEDASWVPQLTLTTLSNADGSFTTPRQVYPGRYRVRFTAVGYPVQFHRSALTFALGTDVIVAENATTTLDSLLIASDTTPPTSTITPLPAGWRRSDVTATITATDGPGGSGVAAMYWRLGDGVQTTSTGPVTVSTEGDHEFRYWAVDGFGNVEPYHSESLRIDKTPPVTTSDAPPEWRSGNVTVSLSATDSVSGVTSTLLGIGGAVPSAYGGSFEVTSEGVTPLSFLSVDVAGNREVTKTASVRIDRTPPSTTASVASSYVGTATIPLVGTDALSGVFVTRWTLDGGALQTGSPVVVRAAGPHTLRYASVDAAGNVEGTKTAEFTVIEPDVTPPVTTISGIPASWTSGTVTFALTATDVGWGVSHTYRRVGAGAVTTYTAPVTVTAEGATTVSYLSVDVAGNREGTRTATVRIDRTPPTVVASIAPAYVGTATVTVTASDALSGLARTWISVDGVPHEAASVTFSTFGTHTVGYWAEDNAGNSSVPVTSVVDVLSSLTIEEVAGLTRFETAVAASQRGYPAGAPVVVLATGRSWPDALGGSALAAAAGGPVLLTEPGVLPGSVAAEISRLGATRVIVLGGTGAVSAGVLAQVDALPAVASVSRVGGRDRYQTAEMVADLAVELAGPDPERIGIVATGLNYPDELAVSPLAAAKRWPVYLSGASGLSASTRKAMSEHALTGALVLGGTAVVPAAVESSLVALYGADAVTRLAGVNRYATAVQVAEYAVAEQGMAWDGVALVRGDEFADALSGGPLQALGGSVMLLTPSNILAPEAEFVLAENRDIIRRLRYIGGSAAIQPGVRQRVFEVLRPLG